MKACIMCGRKAPRSASRKGWDIIQVSRPGKGRHYYRHCGCTTDLRFDDTWHWLFEQSRDYLEEGETFPLGLR